MLLLDNRRENRQKRKRQLLSQYSLDITENRWASKIYKWKAKIFRYGSCNNEEQDNI